MDRFSDRSDSDLNNALQDHADGALIDNGGLIIDASIMLPADKTLYLYNEASVCVSMDCHVAR
ncbi:hypothetical protein GCM10022627_02160 [Haloarcula argentinensis]